MFSTVLGTGLNWTPIIYWLFSAEKTGSSSVLKCPVPPPSSVLSQVTLRDFCGWVNRYQLISL